MELDYLESGSQDCPLIRLQSADAEDFLQLRKAIEQLRIGTEETLRLNKLPFIKSIDGTSLVLLSAATSNHVGVRRLKQAEPGTFEWTLPADKWEWVEELIKPFEERDDSAGYHQWLTGWDAAGLAGDSEIAVVITSHKGGAW